MHSDSRSNLLVFGLTRTELIPSRRPMRLPLIFNVLGADVRSDVEYDCAVSVRNITGRVVFSKMVVETRG